MNFLEYGDVQSIEGYLAESFFQLENFGKTMEIRVFKIKLKSCMVAIHEGCFLGLNFSEWKIPRKKIHKAETPNSKPF